MTQIASRRNVAATSLCDVVWRPFQLNAGSSLEGVDKMRMYNQKFGADRVAAMVPRMKETGAGCEPPIEFSYGGMTGNTLRSHRLTEWAKRQGGLPAQGQQDGGGLSARSASAHLVPPPLSPAHT